VSRQRLGRILRPALATVLAVGALLLLGWLLHQAPGVTPRGAPYRDLPAFRVWAVVCAVAIVTSFAVAVALWRSDPAWRGAAWREPERGLLRWAPHLLYGVLVVLIYLAERAFLALDLKPPLPAQVVLRLASLFVLEALAASPMVLGLWRAYGWLRERTGRLEGPNPAVRPEGVVVGELRRVGRYAQRCLAGLAVLLTVGVVQTGVLRQALLAAGYPTEQFPASWLLLHGAFLAAVLLLVYLPFFLAWRSYVTGLVEVFYPVPEAGLPTDDWIGDRERLERILQGNSTLKQNLSAAFGVLAPLGGSLMGLVLPGLKKG
jgi:hypothetical protein